GRRGKQRVGVPTEESRGCAEQEGANLVALAMQNNTAVRLAQSDVQAKQFRLTGEKRGYWPTLELVSVYSLLAKFNNYAQYFNHFQRNNYNLGIQAQFPVFSPSTKDNVALAQINLMASKASLANKQSQVSADVRRMTRHVRESDAGKEVAR